MADIVKLEALNSQRWSDAVLTGDLGAVPARLVAAKLRYLRVERATGVCRGRRLR